MDSINLLQNLSVENFLQNYWEKKPLLIRQALPQASSYITPAIMHEMALETAIESRFLFIDQQHTFSLYNNPLTDALLQKLKASNGVWTLINHGVNLFHHPMWNLQKSVHFLPQWNFDDIMVTHSSAGGTVGPHIDSYNVFIIQGYGKKKWQLNANPDPRIIPDQPVKILQDFTPNLEYILEEGDMLYLPPHIAHYGVSLTEGMSYSLGFNSIKPAELIDHFMQNLQKQYEDDDIFTLDFSPTDAPWKYTSHIEQQFSQLIHQHCSTSQIKKFVQHYLSTPRYWPSPNELMCFEDFLLELGKQRPIYRDPFLKFFNLDAKTLIINTKNYSFTHPQEANNILTWLDNFPMQPLPSLSTLTLEAYHYLHTLYLNGEIFFGLY